MHIYMAGIGGVGIGPLAEIARGAGFTVTGSDLNESLTTAELARSGIDVLIYPQDGTLMRRVHERSPIGWFVYTSALPDDHPELLLARELGIRTSKRDEFLGFIIAEKQLKLLAVAGTHGKTTTTGMIVWAFTRLGIPVSYSVGSTLSFGPAGLYDDAAEYFVYECDEYDRNFLAFSPDIALVTTIDHDHFDTYPTAGEYTDAFRRFAAASDTVLTWETNKPALGGASNISYLTAPDPAIILPGDHNRHNASLALAALENILPVSREDLAEALSAFPGTDRRFELLAPSLYSDYGHHPAEIAATLQHAHELSERVVLVYQPHQNGRQHEIRDDYTAGIFKYVDRVFWLPTYLTRESGQPILAPEELSQAIADKTTVAALDDTLWQAVEAERDMGALVLFMGAGTIDAWVRGRLTRAE